MSTKIAIVGSGPVSLFEALYHHKLGNKVTIYEGGNELGGAWGVRRYSDEYELEIGCHIWDVDVNTYRFIEQFLEDSLEQLKPTPIVIIRNKKIPYDWKHNILVFKAIKHDFKAFMSGKKFIKPILKPRKYKYPKHGSKQLVDKLLERLKETDVVINRNTLINKIDFEGDKPVLTSGESKNKFDNVIITTFTNIREIGGQVLKSEEGSFDHFLLVINGKRGKKLSYARLMDHSFIHRVSDISDFSNSDKLVFAVGVFKNKLPNLSEAEIAEKIRKELVLFNWIHRDATIDQHFSNEYKTVKIEHHQVSELNKHQNMTVLRSTNFIYSIGNNIDRWKILLKN